MKLKRLGGLAYRGHDFDGKAIHAGPGDVLECSDRRGAKLLADYPTGFEVVAEGGDGDGTAFGLSLEADATTSNPAAGEGAAASPPESPGTGGEPAALPAKKRGRPRKVKP